MLPVFTIIAVARVEIVRIPAVGKIGDAGQSADEQRFNAAVTHAVHQRVFLREGLFHEQLHRGEAAELLKKRRHEAAVHCREQDGALHGGAARQRAQKAVRGVFQHEDGHGEGQRADERGEPRGIQPLAAEYEQRYGQGEGDEKRKAHANDRRCGNGIDHYMSFPRGAGAAAPRRSGGLFYVQLRRHVQLLRRGRAVLFALAHALGQKILYLPVDRAEVILRPRGDGVVQLRRQAQRHLLFRVVRHISKACRS